MRIGLVNTSIRKTLSFDDKLLAKRFAERGYQTDCVFWDDPKQTFTDCDIYINRSCFEYHKHPVPYGVWLDKMGSASTGLMNPPAIIKANMCKSYLQEMEKHGANIIPTRFLRDMSVEDIQKEILATGWQEIICKPFVGAASHDLIRIHTKEITEPNLAAYKDEKGSYSLLVQPFWEDFSKSGEVSFIFFGAEFSHAIIKLPASDDFRVQGRYGGTCELYEASSENVRQASDVLKSSGLTNELLYARIDGVIKEGVFYLSELEINEPWLFFTEAPEACDAFIDRLEDLIAGQKNTEMERAA